MITREEYNSLNAKLDMYIQCQNQREKDFNELERKVYQMEQELYSPSVSRWLEPMRVHPSNPHSHTPSAYQRGTKILNGASCLT